MPVAVVIAPTEPGKTPEIEARRTHRAIPEGRRLHSFGRLAGQWPPDCHP